MDFIYTSIKQGSPLTAIKISKQIRSFFFHKAISNIINLSFLYSDRPFIFGMGRSGADGGYTKLLLLFLIEGKTIAGPSSAARTG